MDPTGKVTIITGASAGIGLATARRFALAGARLVLVARSADKLAELAQELRAQEREVLPLVADMRDPAAVNQMVEEAWRWHGRIDILINNAGQSALGQVARLSLDDFRQVVELNVFGPIYAIQAAVPRMRQAGGGLIINISSGVSKMHIPGLAAYAASKVALNMISDTAREELAPDNIRVITVYPRLTATDFGRNALGSQEARQARAQSTAARQADPPELVAERILDAARREPAEQVVEME